MKIHNILINSLFIKIIIGIIIISYKICKIILDIGYIVVIYYVLYIK